jgi:hypothetical protein
MRAERARLTGAWGPPRGFFTAIVTALLVTLLASSGAAVPTGSLTLRVMSFNIFYGGDELNLQTRQFCKDSAGCPETLDQVATATRASGADVAFTRERARPLRDLVCGAAVPSA